MNTEYVNADLPLHTIQSLIRIGKTYALDGDYASAIRWYQRADTSAQKISNTRFSIEIGRNISSALYQLGDIEQAKAHLLGVYEKYNKGMIPDSYPDLFLLGAIYAKEGSLDQARQYFDRALNEDDAYNVAAIEYELYVLENSKGNHAKALTHLRKYHSLIDSLHFAGEHQSVLEIEKKYDTSQLEYANFRHRTTQRYILIGCILIVAIAALLYKRYRRIIAARNLEIQHYITALSEADRSMNSILNSKNENEKKLKEILERRFAAICNYYDAAYSWQRNSGDKGLLEPIENETFPLVRSIVEARHGGFITKLKQNMKSLLSLFFAGAMMLVLGVGCDKDDPKPELPFKPPHETDDSLFYYAESGEKQYFKLRKDRVIIKAASYDDAQALSGRLIPSFYTGVWVLASIDSLKMGLPEVLALPGALDATYGLEYVGDGMMQYPRNEIFIRPKAGFTPQQVFEQVGMSEEIASIELFNEYHNIYFITLDVSVGGILRRCRRLYESRICEFADPNFFRFRDNFFQIQRYTN